MMRLLPALLAMLWLCTFEVKAATYYLMPVGNLTATTSWNTSPTGGGSSPSKMGLANQVFRFQASGGRTADNHNSGNLLVHPTSTVIIDNGYNLTVSGPGYTSAFIRVSAGGSLTIQNTQTYKLQVLDINSTVIYDFPGVTVKPIAGALSYGNLRIATSTALSGAAISVAGQLIIDAAQTLTLGGIPLRLTGQSASPILAVSGALVGGPLSVIEFSGGIAGNNGTLNLTASSRTLATLALHLSGGSSYITLGNELSVLNGDFIQHTGGIDLNGHDLRITADIEFPATVNSGSFRGSQNSSLHLSPLSYFAGDDIFFDPTANSLRALTLNTSSLTLTIGNDLVIHDSLAILDGALDANDNIFIESTSSLKGRVGRVSGSISGNISIRTYISGGATGWVLLGVGGVAGETVSAWDTYYTTNGASGIPMTCSNCFYQPSDVNPPFQSILGWSESANDYDVNVNGNTALDPGKGFWVYVGDGDVNTNDLNVINTGVPVVGSPGAIALTANASGSDHWNLISNPLPSPISWTKLYNFVGNTNIDAQMQVFSPDHGYQTCTANGTCSHAGLTDVLAMGQGFYVNTSSAASLGFDESVKMDNTNVNIFRTKGQQDEKQLVRLTLEGQGTHDETVLNFHYDASFGFDRVHDANKLFAAIRVPGSPVPLRFTTISTKDEFGVDYAINTMPEISSPVIVPLMTRAKSSGTYSLFVNESLNYNGCLVLHDKTDNEYYDLSKGAYVFEMSDTTTVPRFDLLLCPAQEKETVSVEELNSSNDIFISQNADGAFVRTTFDKPTKATISVFNIVGQQLLKDIEVEGTETMTQLPLNVSNQVVIIRVTTDSETQVKKFIAH